MSKKYVYLFKEGNGSMRAARRQRCEPGRNDQPGLPVPQGFTITTEACTQYYEDGRKINDDIQAEIMEYVGKMEEITGKSSAIWKIRCWFPSVPAPALPCPA